MKVFLLFFLFSFSMVQAQKKQEDVLLTKACQIQKYEICGIQDTTACLLKGKITNYKNLNLKNVVFELSNHKPLEIDNQGFFKTYIDCSQNILTIKKKGRKVFAFTLCKPFYAKSGEIICIDLIFSDRLE